MVPSSESKSDSSESKSAALGLSCLRGRRGRSLRGGPAQALGGGLGLVRANGRSVADFLAI